MPSCVVKSCLNHSCNNKKSQGITFHRFPSANEVWKKDWIQIIRESRNESNWNPSKSSVICSKHFEDNDLYSTKGGLLRVVTYAVPKKFLSDCLPDEASTSSASSFEIKLEPILQEEQPTEVNISDHLQMSLSAVGNDGKVFIQEQTMEQCSSLHKNSSLLDIKLEPILQEEQPTEVNISDHLQMSLSAVGNDRKVFIQEQTMEQCSSHKNSSLLDIPQPNLQKEQPIDENISNPSQIALPTSPSKSNVDFECPLSLLYSNPSERRMKFQIMQMQIKMQNQKKKIKVLNQKVRRLQNKNKSLKDILKTYKEIRFRTVQ